MKKLNILILALATSFTSVFAGGQEQETERKDKIRKVDNKAFHAGEKLEYKISYGFINAATATLEVKKSPNKIQGREILHVVGIGESINTFDWFFKIRDRYETFIDEEGVFPWLFVRRIHEGGYEKEQDYQFFQQQGKVVNEKKESYEVPHGVQDMLSAFYFARTMDFSKAKKGDVFSVQSFVDEELYPIDLVFGGKKTIKIKKGKFDCLIFHPRVQEGRVFKTNEDLTFYITDDENKIPVLVQANVRIGSLKMELTDYKNLANPLALR